MRALVSASLMLAACGSATPAPATAPRARPPTSLRALTDAETSAALAAVAHAHGASAELVHTEAAGAPSRVLVIYRHAEPPSIATAASRVCGATGETITSELSRPTCRYLAIGRLAPDGATLDARYELGTWCPEDDEHVELFAADFDRDGREEVSMMIGERASYVLDVDTFTVQFAGDGIDYALEWPDGTGLIRPVPRREDGSYGPYVPFEFEDDLANPPGTLIQPEDGMLERRRHETDLVDLPLELVPYDAASDCWHTQ
jgi:hypothetical protein